MLSVANKPIMLSVVMLNVAMLSVVAPFNIPLPYLSHVSIGEVGWQNCQQYHTTIKPASLAWTTFGYANLYIL
jgi:hypothetical protein